MEKVLALPDVQRLSDGSLVLDQELGDALLRDLTRRDATLLSRCVDWCVGWVSTEIQRLPAISLARAEARVARARLLALDPRRRQEARQAMTTLAKEGLGRWLTAGEAADGQETWPVAVTTPLTPAGPGQRLAVAVSLLLGLVAAGVAMEGRWIRQLASPSQPLFQVLGSPRLSPDAPLRFCDRHQLQPVVNIRLGGLETSLTATPEQLNFRVWTLPWSEEAFANRAPGTRFPLQWGYAGMEIQPGPEIRLVDSAVANSIGMEFVRVTGGTFKMGCWGSGEGECFDDEKPAHEVKLGDYWLGKTEVTQKQWRAVMGSDPPELKFKGCDDCPVEGVTWEDVQEFIEKLNGQGEWKYRLPTEAEWEYACRSGGKEETYAGGLDVDAVGWYGNSEGKTHPVGQKAPNGLGLYDMSGNVWEWVSDWFDDGYYASSPRDNPGGPSSGSYRVYRGGSWYYVARFLRCAVRGYDVPGPRRGYLGFRLARTR
ncbi:MAG: formylglycine-generating enzyme family protein [Magnetococcales bacterium]|nr:formylglycine-generating enzyme family protein [Magnetococcales bacterium]